MMKIAMKARHQFVMRHAVVTFSSLCCDAFSILFCHIFVNVS